MRRAAFPLATALVLGLALGPAAHAQTIEDKLRSQLRTVLEQLHDLQNTQATLAAQKAAAEQDRDTLKQKLAGAQCHPRPARTAAAASPAALQELAQLKAENARLTEEAKTAQSDVARYKDAYTKVVDGAQSTHAERDQSLSAMKLAQTQLAFCEDKNVRLIKLGRQIIDAYDGVGLRDVLVTREPVTGFKRLQLERLAQDYGDRVYENRFDRRTVKTLPTPPPAQAIPSALNPQPTDAPPPAPPAAAPPAKPQS